MEKQKAYYKNTYHHLYNRGVNKATVFFEDSDYKYFLRKMKEYKEKYFIQIICYCLLPNHFHLFTKQLTDEHTPGKLIGDLTNAYTKGTNKKYDRTGVLFQGKTKSKLIDDESYFVWLCKYILNNPVEAGLVKQVEDWNYSSAKEYINIIPTDLTDTDEILSRFDSIDSFKSFIMNKQEKFDYSKLF